MRGIIIALDMEEPPVKNQNVFGRWDSVFASMMIAIFPAVVAYVFEDKNISKMVLWGGVSVAVGGAVFLLSFVFSKKLLSFLVNLMGYIFLGIYIWWASQLIGARLDEAAADPALEKLEQKKQ